MDPTAIICKVRNSFEEKPPEFNASMLPRSYKLTDLSSSPVPGITVSEAKNVPPIYCDVKAYQSLQRLKDQIGDAKGNYTDARNRANPFEFLGNSIFFNRAGLKLANVDGVYNVTGHVGAFLKLRSPGPFTFCSIADGPGAFTQYVQWRRPESFSYGMTLRNGRSHGSSLDWDKTKIDMTRFKAIYGEDGTGDLYKNWDGFVNEVKTIELSGVDLVIGDGGFDVEEGGDYDRQEFLSSRLLLAQILTAVSVLRTGGTFVCKLFDTVTEFSAQLLYFCGIIFEEISILKPVSSRPANAERYIICQRLRGTDFAAAYAGVLAEVNNRYTSTLNVTSFLEGSLPKDFTDWLTEQNTISINLQTETINNILAIMKGQSVDIPKYDLHKCLIVWNLPDNPITKRSILKDLVPYNG